MNTSKLPENRRRLFFRRIMKARKRATRGGHRVSRRPPGAAPPLAAPGGRLGPLEHSRLPPLAYVPLVVQKTLKEKSFRSSAADPWRKPTEKKSHLWRADSAGEITSRKGSRRHRHHHRHGHH